MTLQKCDHYHFIRTPPKCNLKSMCIIAQVARVQFSIEPQRRFYSFSINKKCLFISHFCKGGGNATLNAVLTDPAVLGELSHVPLGT